MSLTTVSKANIASFAVASACSTLAVFDERVSDLAVLQAALVSDCSALVVSKMETEVLARITQQLTETGATHLALVAHGEPGVIYLGAEPLTLAMLRQQAGLLAEWGVAEITLYACEVGADPAFVEALGQLTGARVRASRAKVGAVALGGSWALAEAEMSPFVVEKLANYAGVLATFTGTSGDDEAKANPGIIAGFTGGTLAELQDGVGDTFNAGGGNDAIVAGDGNDTLNGDAGDDTLNPGLGDDRVNGGANTDTLIVDYSGNDNTGGGNQGIKYTSFGLASGSGSFYARKNNDATFDQVVYDGIEKFNITGTKYGDEIRGGNNNDILIGGGGDDTLKGYQGIDVLSGGAGNDLASIDLSNTSTNNLVDIITSTTNYGATLSSIEALNATGGSGNDTLVGGALTDNLDGGAGDDVLNAGTGGDDRVTGGANTDTLIVDYSGNDNASGSSGSSGIKYINFGLASGSASFYANKNNNATYDQVVYDGIEKFNITGTKYGDEIRGGNNNDILIGGGGDDTLNGYQGIDVLSGGAGNDLAVIDLSNTSTNNLVDIITSTTNYGATLSSIEALNATGGTGNDTLVGGALTDNLVGGAGDDVLNAGTGGDDRVNGGANTDTLIVDYSGNDNASGSSGSSGIKYINFGLASGSASFYANKNNNATYDQVVYDGIEKFNITGTKYNDEIRGGNNNDILIGGAGSDNIQGFGGNDILKGASAQTSAGTQGIDTLTGGAGRDTFILGEGGVDFYDDGNSTTAGTDGYALITDFDARQDSIQLGKSLDNYTFTPTTLNGVTGTGIYLNKPAGEPAELMALIQGSTVFSFGLPQGSSGSNQGQVTFTVAGQNFLPNDVISLVDSNGVKRTATKTYWVDDTQTWATIDLTGLNPGKYDVKIENGSNIATLSQAFTVTNGAVAQVNASVGIASNLKGNNDFPFVIQLNYNNSGQTDAAAPLLRIKSTNVNINYGSNNTSSSALQQLESLVLGTSNTGPAGILTPGSQQKQYLAFKSTGNGAINFTVEQVNPAEVIDWATIKTQMRADYSYIDATAWDTIWTNFIANVGSTMGQFQAAIDKDTTQFSQLGQKITNVGDLFRHEFYKAANLPSSSILSSVNDVFDAAPGLALTFDRSFYQSTAERYNLGIFGRGWNSSWETSLTKDSLGNAYIGSTGELRVKFTLQADGTFATLPDGTTLTLVAGQYQARNSNGNVSIFGANGKLQFLTDSNGNQIALQYTGNLLTQLVQSNGDSLNLTYNAQGRVTTITDSTGKTTNYSYDAANEHLLTVTDATGATTYTYDTGTDVNTTHSLLSITSDLGYKANFEYDSLGRVSKEYGNDPANFVSYSYDQLGNITSTDANGVVTTGLVGWNGSFGQIRSANNQNTVLQYDPTNGNLTSIKSPSNNAIGSNIFGGNTNTTALTYDSKGNITQSDNSASDQNLQFTYNGTFNGLTSFKDTLGNGVNYSYDSKGNILKFTYADGSTQQFGVDSLGNVTSSVNRRGSTIAYTYNKDGQITQKQYPDGSAISYTYDAKGNLATATDATGTITLTYDAANRLTGINYPNGRSLTYTYNADGQRTSITSQDGNQTNYSYDSAGRLETLTNGAGQTIATYTYDAVGRLSKETNGNGTTTAYTYDVLNNVTSVVNTKADGTVNSSFVYTYNALNQRISMTTTAGTFSYGYDAAGQLISVITPDNRTIQYEYNAAGNRTAVVNNGTTTGYNSNNLNEYTSVGDDRYTYDRDGNLISKTANGQTSTYTYNADNRLVRVVTPTGTWDYQYDALGNRTATILNGQRTDYLIDPTGLGNVVGEYDNSGNLVANYNYGLGLVSQVNGSNANYYDADALGSIVGLSNSTGAYVNSYSYLPFGEDLTKVEGVANPFEYVGQFGVMDEGNGLDFMRARFYDPSLGRFTNQDPIGLNGQDTNFYRYVSNNPTNSVDPSGLIRIPPTPSSPPGGNFPNPFPGGAAGAAGEAAGEAAAEVAAEVAAEEATVGIIPLITDILIPLVIDFTTFLISKSPYIIIPIVVIKLLSPPAKAEEPPSIDGPPNIVSGGDPHLTTLDGINYDFQGKGEYTLVKSTADDFEIQVRQEPLGGFATLNTAVALLADGSKIGFYVNNPNTLFIDGVSTPIADREVFAAGSNLITRSGNTFTIVTAKGDTLELNSRGSYIDVGLGLNKSRQGLVTGLLGNFNGNPSDEYALRDGTQLGGSITFTQLYGTYNDSWRIDQANSLFNYISGQSTSTFTQATDPTTVLTSTTITPAQRAAALAVAQAAGITDPQLLEDAILDLFVSNNDPNFIQGYQLLQKAATANAPNTLINPDSFGTQSWVAAGSTLPFNIRFSNQNALGTTPIAKVTITQQLDSDLDLNTFSFGDISFGNTVVTIPFGQQSFLRRVDLRSTQGIFVDIDAALDPTTRTVTWSLVAIDPTTNNPVDSSTKGFLLPNDTNGVGVGLVSYSAQPLNGTATGTRVNGQASISFNNQPPTNTDAVFVTLDGDTPQSNVASLPATTNNPSFTVSWAGTDASSGINSYDVYVSADGGPFTIWKSDTTRTSDTYTGQPGSTYRFYSIANDNVGNTEAAPATADAQITIDAPNLPTNNPPAGTDKTITSNEDAIYTFSTSDFGFSDPNNTPANTLSQVKITTLPTVGTLKLNGINISTGDFITAADITAGKLTFTPAANANGLGYSSLTFQVQDNGGTANGGIDLDPTPNTLTFNITPINDPATITGTPTASVTEDASAPTLTATGTLTVNDVDAGENIFNTAVTSAPGNLGTLSITPTGTFSYSVANSAVQNLGTGQTKTETFTVKSIDGTATQNIVITINGVNDAPTGSATAILTAGTEDTAYLINTSNLLTGFSEVDGDTLSVANLTATNGTLVNNNNGTYTFTPNANYNGTVNLNYNVIDGNGGSIPATQSFSLAAVNDAPTLSNIAKTGAINTVISFTATDFTSVFSDIDGDSLSKIQITSLPTNGTLNLNGAPVSLNQEIAAAALSTLTCTPTANYSGPVSFGWNGFDGTTYAVTGASVNVTINSGSNPIQGTPGTDNLMGTDGVDIIDGKAGNDSITGKKGDDTLTGGGNRDTFILNLGDGTDTITDFGGVGTGSNPSPAIRAEVDTLQFQGTGLTARNLLLIQNGSNLEISFEGITGNKVILQNFDLQNLDNLPAIQKNPAIGNILFDGQTSIADSYDVFDANSTQKGLFNRNTVTFLNDLDNTVTGFDNSDDVINGQEGNDTLNGKSGNDLLRGGTGNDKLFGGAGNDILRGGTGFDTLSGGNGSDIFVLTSGEGTDTITDFNRTADKIGLANGLSFGQLTITQGTGSNARNTFIADSSSNELLAILSGVQANTLTSGMFMTV